MEDDQQDWRLRADIDDARGLLGVLREARHFEKELEPLKSFTLPGGGVLNAFLHQARTVCRRAERVCWRLKREEDISDNLIIYVNRLSDHLFVQSRWVAKRLGEPEFLWDRALRIEEEEKTARAAKSKARRGAKS